MRHRIIKINGEEMIVEGNANSLLDLTRSLLTSINLIGTREAFGEREIDAFLAEADKVIDMLRPHDEPSGNGDVAAADFSPPPES